MNALLPAPTRLSLLLLLLLAPGVGLAGQESSSMPSTAQRSDPLGRLAPASTGLPGTAERAPLRLSGDDWARQDEASRPSQVLRIMAETGAGILTGLGGGFVGVLAGGGLCGAGIGSSGGFLPCLNAMAVGLILGASTGLSLGVWWGGEAAGGDGRLLGAMAGLGVGLAASLIVGLAVQTPTTALLLAIPISLIGSIVGYELTQQEPAPGSQGLASPRPGLQPVLAFSSRGALVGLGGSF